jgi:hypothetical protein
MEGLQVLTNLWFWVWTIFIGSTYSLIGYGRGFRDGKRDGYRAGRSIAMVSREI